MPLRGSGRPRPRRPRHDGARGFVGWGRGAERRPLVRPPVPPPVPLPLRVAVAVCVASPAAAPPKNVRKKSEKSSEPAPLNWYRTLPPPGAAYPAKGPPAPNGSPEYAFPPAPATRAEEGTSDLHSRQYL